MKKVVSFLLIAIMVLTCIAFADEKNLLVDYSDVSTWHWAYETIQKLSSKGIISGYPDGSFKPSNNITRAESAKILMMALNPNGIFPYGIDVCSDVTRSHWASRYVINAQSYITLYDDRTFKPDQYITRLEFINAVARSLEFTNVVVKPDANIDEVFLTDLDGLDSESVDNIKFLIRMGIVNGYEDNTFRPNNCLTRAEACKVLSLSMIYRENGIKDIIADKKSWTQVDPTSGWNSDVYFDTDGNMKFHIIKSDNPIQLYYNGEYFMTPNNDVLTIKKEKLYTPDGLEWDVVWFGSKVVDCYMDKDEYVITNYYQDKTYRFDTDSVSKKEAEEILKELFPYLDHEFYNAKDGVRVSEYTANTHYNMGGFSCENSYLDENDQLRINVEDLESVIWMEEVNGNTQSRIDWINEGL